MKKILFLTLLTTGMFFFTSCDNDDDINPDRIFKEALSAKYPEARAIEWEKKRNYHVAECTVNNKELDVWFDTSAKWVMTETELTRADLPAAVLTTFEASNYATWRMDDQDKLEYASADTRYVIEVEQGNTEIDLYYAEDGTFIEEKDVSRSDDTHWPE